MTEFNHIKRKFGTEPLTIAKVKDFVNNLPTNVPNDAEFSGRNQPFWGLSYLEVRWERNVE